MEIYLTDEKDFIKDEGIFSKISEIVLKEVNSENLSTAELSILITDDETIHQLNLQYRNIDKPTDVLSFAMEDDAVVSDIKILGDIVISLETATRMADEFEMSLIDEVAFLYIHGLLHLIGYDHEKSDEDEKIMFQLQEKIYNEWKKECR